MLNEKVMLPVVGGEVLLTSYCQDVIPNITDSILRPAVVIAGGGAYAYVSPRETEPVAMRFAGYGINAYTVLYRTAPTRYPRNVQDLAAAVAWVRAHAAEHHTDPNRIAVLGFSAGGHCAANLGVAWQNAELWQELGLTPEQVRPNGMILCYPVITGGPFAHRGSFENLTGSEDLAVHEQHSLENQVTANAPETFMWSTWEDNAVPIENTLMMAMALRKADVGVELHIFRHGEHGLSLSDETTDGLKPDPVEVQQWFPLTVAYMKRLNKA